MRREEGDSDRRDTVLDRPHSPTSLPTQQRPDDPTTKKSKRAEPLPPGTMAGRYVLLARLGAGGAGLVYAAFDPQLDRKVAIKVLRAIEGEHPNAESARARLLREAQAMARLKHPNVLPVYDVGAFEDAHGSRVFIAMELVESGTLRTWFKERKRSRREVLDVMTACGRGLAAAHAAGLVHRDFKPDNVLVGNDGRVFVTDFGLVRTVGSSENPPVDSPQPPPTAMTAPLTGAHAVMGTPGYMAPEQYEAGAIDERTDQFSFCVTLCEGLCGHKIFRGRTLEEAKASTHVDRARDAMQEAKVPAWLARVIVRGLSHDRDARYPSMTALLAALAADPARRVRRVAMVVGAIVVVTGTVYGTHALSQHREEQCSGAETWLAGIWDAPARARARQAFEHAGVGQLFPSVGDALDRYAADLVTQHRDACVATRIRGDQPETVLALRTSCLAAREKELATLASLLGDADRDVAFRAMQSVASLSSVRGCADIAALTARVPPPADLVARQRVELLRAMLAQAKVLVNAVKYPEARGLVDQVLAAEPALGYGPLRAEALALLADLQREQDGDMKSSEQSLVSALDAAYAAHDDERVATTSTELAMLRGYWLGEHQDGQRWVQFAHSAIVRIGGSDELEAERGRVEAELYIGEDKGSAAVAAALPALRLADKLYGPASIQASVFHATVGAAESTAGDEARAREHYTAQYKILHDLVGPDHPLVAMALNNLGLNAEAEGRLDAAEKHYRDSITLLENALGRDHPRVAIALSNFGTTLQAEHKSAEALAAFQRALDINTQRFGADYVDSFDALLGEGKALTSLGRPREARAPLEHALKIATSGEPSAWSTADAKFALAAALWEVGRDRKRARQLAAEARTGMAGVSDSVAHRTLAEIDEWLTRHP
ncbi:MAG TPA: serine/threonine-protein kinase [Kofleriaceae bacterium]